VRVSGSAICEEVRRAGTGCAAVYPSSSRVRRQPARYNASRANGIARAYARTMRDARGVTRERRQMNGPNAHGLIAPHAYRAGALYVAHSARAQNAVACCSLEQRGREWRDMPLLAAVLSMRSPPLFFFFFLQVPRRAIHVRRPPARPCRHWRTRSRLLQVERSAMVEGGRRRRRGAAGA